MCACMYIHLCVCVNKSLRNQYHPHKCLINVNIENFKGNLRLQKLLENIYDK